MAMRPASRAAVGSAPWCAEERSSALQIARSEVEEFGYSARNEVEWLNEHMADIFSENQINVAEIFKTPGKLRGKTPRTVRKVNHGEDRVPLSDIFSATPLGAPRPFTTSILHHARTPNFKIAEDPSGSPGKTTSIARKPVPPRHTPHDPVGVADSGYYGSQTQDVAMDSGEPADDAGQAPPSIAEPVQSATAPAPAPALVPQAEETLPEVQASTFEETTPSTEEEPANTATNTATVPAAASPAEEDPESAPAPPSSPVQLLGDDSLEKSPAQPSPPKAQLEPPESPSNDQQTRVEFTHEPAQGDADADGADVTRSPSDGSSPIRPVVRKSSLNFASLPAREPLTSNKSLGARMSRTSQIEQTRTSYFPRHTGGKSIGVRQDALEDDGDAMDVDADETAESTVEKTQSVFATHNKSYTQRLQDQINMLGKSQTGGTRPSKSIPNLGGTQQSLFAAHAQNSQPIRPAPEERPRSPPRHQQFVRTPGAFPEDDEDDWIIPPATNHTTSQSPRPGIVKSRSADATEGLLLNKSTVGGIDSDLPRDHLQDPLPKSPRHSPVKPPPLTHQSKSVLSHGKSISVPEFFRNNGIGDPSRSESIGKPVSVSNPLVDKIQDVGMTEAPKSPSKDFRDNPLRYNALKTVKSKFSSILKGSKGLLASSAALSAEGKASLVNSPSTTRLHKENAVATEVLVPQQSNEPLYPDLTKHMSSDSHSAPSSSSPSRSNSRKTRASAERDRRDQKQKEKEDKEAQQLADQMERLERAREQERERAHVQSFEKREKAAAEKQTAMQKEREKGGRTPAPKDAAKSTRTSPRKAQPQPQPQLETEDEEMGDPEAVEQDAEASDAPSSKAAPPSIPRPITGQTLKAREIKRPIKPTREPAVKPKQAPTLIRVNTSSQHTGFHPSNSALAASLQDTLGNDQQQNKTRPPMQTKTSSQNLKSSVNSATGRPKALELAEKRRQEEERKAQHKKQMKAEMERKREEDRRQEEERREKERQRAAAEEQAKKMAARQAAVEKAKQTKAPPPVVRSQAYGVPGTVSRPPSRMGQSILHRSQEDISRPVNVILSSSTAKTSMKRPLPQESAADASQRPAVGRTGPSQQNEAKRMRMSDEFDPEEEMEIQSYGTNIKGPPVRPSAGFKKDLSNKSLFSSGHAPAPQGVTRDIFKAPVASQHGKSGHPLDMAQVSKGHIPFASSQHGAGPSQHKTPARPAGVGGAKSAVKSAAKSATRSSPRFQNGESIELPEIDTDEDEDDDEDDRKEFGAASWADTPELRRELMRQETLDPLQVFGPPAPLKLEEVFKNKDRWSKFRARTSSANWGGTDRLTEDEIRKDIAAREKMRRDGGWSYELSKDVA